MKKFEETGVVTNIERPLHRGFARAAKNIFIVSESVAKLRLLLLKNDSRVTQIINKYYKYSSSFFRSRRSLVGGVFAY